MNQTVAAFGALGLAIAFEVTGTAFLQGSQQFTKLVPTVLMAVCYVASFYFLSHTLKTIPVGLAYAIWSGLGVVLISLIGWLVFRQSLDLAAVIGLAFIIVGVIIVNAFSKSLTH
ncbi:MAG: QacE family quaternary ammonium compound efflux SMR transporter [Actinobacteria bacterium]|nr:QacE family quaternary ammonium compound efflux SMR transporter [Actinomycetota bacterium]OPZ76524.1 MAG: Multidrug transporter EmrE [Actinobacteria bacterium ADurb.Bin444]